MEHNVTPTIQPARRGLIALAVPLLLVSVVSGARSTVAGIAAPTPPGSFRFAMIGELGSAVYPEEGQVAKIIYNAFIHT
ncbi:MAG: hypothetical protein ACJ78Q_02895 [Chloroflexia bacterium]